MNIDFKDKRVIGIVIAVIMLIGSYLIMRGRGSQPTDSLEIVSSDPIQEILGAEFLMSLDRMKSIPFDTKFFDDPVFKSLTDYTVEIPKQPVGRRNPFAPLD